MKKLLFLYCTILFHSCGIIEDTEEESFEYTYRLRNETGVALFITIEGNTSQLTNGEGLQCSYFSPFNVGLCQQFLEIRFTDNSGYRCHGAISDTEGLCFTDEVLIFGASDSEPTIFTEANTRVYEYTLTPELLENPFELPD